MYRPKGQMQQQNGLSEHSDRSLFIGEQRLSSDTFV